PTANVVVRFIAADNGGGSLVEAAVDDFKITSLDCDAGAVFARGDSNIDGTINISDAIFTLGGLFGGGSVLLECEDAADANDDGLLNIADPITLLESIFAGGGPLPGPYPNCGSDPSSDDLECDVSPPCP
ncbi:MAG: hypothetical protein V3T77_02140, partial [Planctomycetota bacterium]